MAPRFYSKEWLDACIEKANNDKAYRSKTEKHDASYLFIVTDCPDGNDIRVLMNFDKGKASLKEYDVEPTPAGFRMENVPWNESISLLRAQGDYDTFRKLNMKVMNPMQAMTSGSYKTEGDMMKAIMLIHHVTAYNDIQSTVECEY